MAILMLKDFILILIISAYATILTSLSVDAQIDYMPLDWERREFSHDLGKHSLRYDWMALFEAMKNVQTQAVASLAHRM